MGLEDEAGGTADEVTAGGSHSCARSGGDVVCWGFNGHGQLGDGTTDSRSTAVPPPLLDGVPGVGPLMAVSGFSSVRAGWYHSCGLLGGGAKCWGYNAQGQLGDGTTTSSASPVDVAGVSDAFVLALGFRHGCAATGPGDVWCWGYNNFAQLGDGTRTNRSIPVHVFDAASQLTAGQFHSCALRDGAVFCWGSNTYGQLGDGTFYERRTPTAVLFE